MDGIRAAISAVHNLEEEAWTEFENSLKPRNLLKGEILWSVGDVCRHVVFLKTGLIRTFLQSDKKVDTYQFFFENRLLADYYSFVSQQPCSLNYEAIEDCELMVITRTDIYNLYDRFRSFERFGRLLAERNLIGVLSTTMNLKGLSPEERYLALIKERPKVMQRVPLSMIASYLGIGPEYLSRIRKKISESSN